MAHYRNGDWKAAVGALKKVAAQRGGDHGGWLILAMAHWQLGHKDEANAWHNRAVQWMDKYKPRDEELGRFRTEAAELLGINEKKD